MKVLLLYASFGDGHRQVASALSEAFGSRDGIEVVEIDTFRQTHTRISRFNEWLYETLTRFLPFLYGWSYDWTRSVPSSHWLWECLAIFSRRAAWHSLTTHQPDVVVQLFPDHALAKLPSGLLHRPLLVTVMTDFAIHSRWFHRNVDLYFLPSPQAMNEASAFQSPNARSVVSGIPIRAQFSNRVVPSHLGRPTIVISAGGRGVFPDLGKVIDFLLQEFPAHKIHVLCGRNRTMYSYITQLRDRHSAGTRIEPHPFTDQISSLIQQADFVVAKAGGVTISECMASATPMLFYKPQPGQEKGNALAIEQLGGGRVAYGFRDLPKIAQDFQAERLTAMKEACCSIGSPHAARTVVEGVSEMYANL